MEIDVISIYSLLLVCEIIDNNLYMLEIIYNQEHTIIAFINK